MILGHGIVNIFERFLEIILRDDRTFSFYDNPSQILIAFGRDKNRISHLFQKIELVEVFFFVEFFIYIQLDKNAGVIRKKYLAFEVLQRLFGFFRFDVDAKGDLYGILHKINSPASFYERVYIVASHAEVYFDREGASLRPLSFKVKTSLLDAKFFQCFLGHLYKFVLAFFQKA